MSPFGNEMSFDKYCLYKFVKLLKERNMSSDDFYRMVDINNDGSMDSNEIK